MKNVLPVVLESDEGYLHAASAGAVASLLGVGLGHLANMRAQGTGPEYLLHQGRVYYEVTSLHRWIRSEQERLTPSS